MPVLAKAREFFTGVWANDISLSARDKADLLAWIESKDRPLGAAAEAPAKRVYPEEWSIGQPDLIVPLSRAYTIKATGFMPYLEYFTRVAADAAAKRTKGPTP